MPISCPPVRPLVLACLCLGLGFNHYGGGGGLFFLFFFGGGVSSFQDQRDQWINHTVQVTDLSGIGAVVTGLCGKMLNDVLLDVKKRKILSTNGFVTVVGWKADRRQKRNNCPWLSYSHSKLLDRQLCTITLKRVSGSHSWRAICSGHNCSRSLLPCSGLLALYPAVLKPGDVHPRWLLTTHSGTIDDELPGHSYLGLDVTADRRDYFGCTPDERRDAGDFVSRTESNVRGHRVELEDEEALPDDVGDGEDILTGETDHWEDDVDGEPASATTHVSFSDLTSAANLVIKFTGDETEARRKLLFHFQELAESARAGALVFVPGASAQQRSILHSPSNRSTKV
jgi:hypothetical protein